MSEMVPTFFLRRCVPMIVPPESAPDPTRAAMINQSSAPRVFAIRSRVYVLKATLIVTNAMNAAATAISW